MAGSNWNGMVCRSVRFSDHQIGFYKNVTMLHIEITRFLLIYTWESCKDSLLWNLRTLKSGAINRWKRFTNIWLMYSGLILISTVLIIIFEYDHFSEVLGKPLGEVTVIDVLMQSLWWSVATIYYCWIWWYNSSERLREINCYGLYVGWLWVEIVYLNWCVQKLHKNIESLLVFDVIWQRWWKQAPLRIAFFSLYTGLFFDLSLPSSTMLYLSHLFYWC